MGLSRWAVLPVCVLAIAMPATAATARTAGPARGPNAVGMSPNAGAIPAQILANERIAYAYFVQRGLSAIQSAGIIGNFDVESGMDPTIQQPGGPGRGIAQWGVGGRWDTDVQDNMLWYANQHGESPTALTAQLDFTWYELTSFSNYGLSGLRAASTITSAVTAFQDNFEGCGSCNTSGRISYAQSAYQRYGGSSRLPTASGTAVAMNTTEVDYFSRSAAGHLVQHAYSYASGWQAAQDLGAPPSGLTWDPDASSWGAGRIDIASRDSNAHLVMRSYSSGAWSSWQTYTDVSMLSSPSVVDTASNNIVVFWLGTNHQLFRRAWNSTGWSTVAAIPGVANAASGPDAVTWQVGSGHIDVVYRGTDGKLWTVTYNVHWLAPTLADPAHPLPGTAASVDPGSGTTGTGDFSVYVTTTDGNIYHASGNTLTGAWSAWYAVIGPAQSTAAPDTATVAPNVVNVVTAANGTLIATYYANHAWAPWQAA